MLIYSLCLFQIIENQFFKIDKNANTFTVLAFLYLLAVIL